MRNLKELTKRITELQDNLFWVEQKNIMMDLGENFHPSVLINRESSQIMGEITPVQHPKSGYLSFFCTVGGKTFQFENLATGSEQAKQYMIMMILYWEFFRNYDSNE